MAKKRELKTLEDLRVATLTIVPDDAGYKVEASAAKHLVTRQQLSRRSVSEFYSTELDWYLPKERGGLLISVGRGDTMQEALETCRADLKNELEERGRKRRLAAAQIAPVRALPAPPMKCLEYQP